jgi:hypothetical protein
VLQAGFTEEDSNMAKRLSTKHKKRRKDQAVAYAKGEGPAAHKVAVERSAKARKKNANRSA